MKKIVAVFKTHVDVGFTQLSSEILKGFSNKMPYEVAQVCDRIPGFKWTMPAWPLYKAIHSGNEGAELARQLVEEDKLLWHGLPFTTHTEFCGTEELIRGLYFSKRLSEELHKPMPIAAKMTDVPGHTRGLVSILAKAGIKFLHLGCNPACMSPEVPRLFYWEAQDGSRVLTFYSKGSYGSSLLPPADWPYPVWLAMLQTNDNTGTQSADDIVRMQDEAEAEGYQLVLGTLDEFYRELEPYLGDSVPVVTGDLADTWIHGAGSYPAEVAKLRKLRFSLLRQEACSELKRAEGSGNFNEKQQAEYDSVYENCLLFGEHTWGLDVKTYLGNTRKYSLEDFRRDKELPAYQLMEESWNEQRNRLNQHAVDIEAKSNFGMESRGDSAALLENSCLAVTLAQDGLQIRDKRTGSLYSEEGFGVFQYDQFSNEDITEFIRTYSYRFFDWSINDLGRMSYPEMEHRTIRYDAMTAEENKLFENDIPQMCCDGIETTVNVHPEKPYVDITYSIGNKIETPLVESGHIVLPFNLAEDYRVEFSKPGGVVDIETDIVKNANHALYCCEKWIRIFDKEKGILIIPVSNPLFSVGDNMIYRFEGQYKRRKPSIWINVFNNAWGTNFPQWMGGDYEFKIRIVPYTGCMTDAKAAEIANETFSDFGIGNIVETESKVELLAFKHSMDGKGSVLRIKSTSGEAQTISIKPCFDYVKCSYATILEDKIYDFEGEILFTSAPYEIHTLYFERR